MVPVLQATDPNTIAGAEVQPVALWLIDMVPEAAPLAFVATLPDATICVPPQFCHAAQPLLPASAYQLRVELGVYPAPPAVSVGAFIVPPLTVAVAAAPSPPNGATEPFGIELKNPPWTLVTDTTWPLPFVDAVANAHPHGPISYPIAHPPLMFTCSVELGV
jgi:hypothetical protein